MFKFLFLAIILTGLKSSRGFIDLSNPIVFYDLKTKEPLHAPITTILPDSENESFNMSSVINIRLPFIGQPCESRVTSKSSNFFIIIIGGCASLSCGCCAGMAIEQFSFDQKSKCLRHSPLVRLNNFSL